MASTRRGTQLRQRSGSGFGGILLCRRATGGRSGTASVYRVPCRGAVVPPWIGVGCYLWPALMLDIRALILLRSKTFPFRQGRQGNLPSAGTSLIGFPVRFLPTSEPALIVTVCLFIKPECCAIRHNINYLCGAV